MKNIFYVIILFFLPIVLFASDYFISVDGNYLKVNERVVEGDKYLVSEDFFDYAQVGDRSIFEEDRDKDTGLYDLEAVVGRMGTHYKIKGKYFEINNAVVDSYTKEDTFYLTTLFKTDIKYYNNSREVVISVLGKDITYSYAPIKLPEGIKGSQVKNENNKLTFCFKTYNKIPKTKPVIVNTNDIKINFREMGVTTFANIEDVLFQKKGDSYLITLKEGALSEASCDVNVRDGHLKITLPNGKVGGQVLGEKKAGKLKLEIGEKEINCLLSEIMDVTGEIDDNNFVIKITPLKTVGKALNEISIVLDPGHGGKEFGAGRHDVWEKFVNYDMCLVVKEVLEKEGVNVIMTRDLEGNPSLAQRGQMSIDNNCDFFISVHSNSTEGEDRATGFEDYYHKNLTGSKYIAACIHDCIAPYIKIPDRGVKSDTVMYKSGYGVLRSASKERVPCTLIETGFINHYVDRELIQSPEFKEILAKGILKGIELYTTGKPLNKEK